MGACWLRDPRIAQCVADTLQFGGSQLKLYELIAWVVMPNHVHVLLRPNVPLATITKSVKQHTARRANQMLRRVGESFWQDESYDHWARSSREQARITLYIEENPVLAGLVKSPEQWRSSSAWGRHPCLQGEPT
jgi:REP element-mobilizing transposase RayT